MIWAKSWQQIAGARSILKIDLKCSGKLADVNREVENEMTVNPNAVSQTVDLLQFQHKPSQVQLL